MVLFRHFWLIGILLSFPGQANQRYQASIEQSRWELQITPVRCELNHPIPRYGEGSFVYSAGGELSFIMHVMQPTLEDSVANMLSVPPFWKSGMDEKELGQVSLGKGPMLLYADRVMAQRMLYELDAGMFPTLAFKDWADKQDEVTVALSSVNFHDALPQFLNCIGQLIDTGSDRPKEVAILFEPGKHKLNEKAQRTMDNLVLYAKRDNKIMIRLQGQADNIGPRDYNRPLSDKRTQAVIDYLVKAGISRKQIKQVANGKSISASGNQFTKGQDLNRVMVKLERLP